MVNGNGKTSVFPTPPYAPFKSFLNFIERLEQLVPPRIDRSFLNRYYSGTMGSLLLTALRFLGLIEGDDNRVTPLLERLVNEKDTRKQLLKELLFDRYSPVFSDIGDLSKATHGQLEESFKQRYKIDGETRRKAISFFIRIAQETDVPISMYIRTATNPGRKTVSRSIPRRTRSASTDLDSSPVAETQVALPNEQLYHHPATQNMKVMMYPNGETTTLTYSGDVFSMNKEYRDFLFSLIDQMEEFEQKNLMIKKEEITIKGEGEEMS